MIERHDIYPWQGYIYQKIFPSQGGKKREKRERGKKKRAQKREREKKKGKKGKRKGGKKGGKNKGWGKCKKKKIGKRDELVYGVLHSAIFLQICQKLL